LKVAGSDGDALGVAERSNAVLRMVDALPLMAGFSRAEPRLTAAVAASLTGHQDTAAATADRARPTLEGPSPFAGTWRPSKLGAKLSPKSK
jgi:hypothetical protein